MDWSKTKTIFIAVFLVLDIFLAVMFFNKYGASRFEVIKQTTIEEKLQTDGVKYEKMPTDSGERSIITAKPKTFDENDLLFLTGQNPKKSGTTIESKLEKPYQTDGAERSKLNSFVKNNVFKGNEYAYWERHGDEVIYYQKIKGEKLFENSKGKLILTLDDKENIIEYSQTMLSVFEENQDEEEIFPSLKALEALYTNGLIRPDSEIGDVELGYYTLAQFTDTELQVLSPTWYFQLKIGDKTEDVYVNALNGTINSTQKES